MEIKLYGRLYFKQVRKATSIVKLCSLSIDIVYRARAFKLFLHRGLKYSYCDYSTEDSEPNLMVGASEWTF